MCYAMTIWEIKIKARQSIVYCNSEEQFLISILFLNVFKRNSLITVSDCCLTPNEQFFSYIMARTNKMNCELMLTYDTTSLQQTGSRTLMGPKTLPTIWGTYMKLVTKYQISAINICWEKFDEKWAYMFNVYKN